MSRPAMTEAERAAYREQKRQEAEDRLDLLLTEGGWATWLRLRRNLHSYSWTNQVLIAEQAHHQHAAAEAGCWARDGWKDGAPDVPCSGTPTLVKSAGRWKKDGYHPAKGSRALFVWTPHERGRKHDGAWACCGTVYPKKVSTCDKCGRSRLFFLLKPAFDASQVRGFETGEPPEIDVPHGEPIEGEELSWLLGPLASWALENDVVATYDLGAQSEHGEGGSWNPQTRHLRVCCGGSGNHRLRVLIHELAHAKGITSARPIRGDEEPTGLALTYAECEVAVECVSYVVAATAGLDTSSEAIPYMAGWGGEDARQKVRALAKLIDETAKTLEEPILRLLEPVEEHEGVAA